MFLASHLQTSTCQVHMHVYSCIMFFDYLACEEFKVEYVWYAFKSQMSSSLFVYFFHVYVCVGVCVCTGYL